MKQFVSVGILDYILTRGLVLQKIALHVGQAGLLLTSLSLARILLASMNCHDGQDSSRSVWNAFQP
jgi:hypothetical protein